VHLAGFIRCWGDELEVPDDLHDDLSAFVEVNGLSVV
jgi:hypothetical protein